MKRIFLSLLVLGMAASLSAQDLPESRTSPEPIVTDRPDFTESAETVPARMVQVEAGYTFANSQGAETKNLGEVLTRIGISKRTELRLSANSFVIAQENGNRTTGIEDSSLGFKLKLIDGSDTPGFGKPAIALLAGTSLPTGTTSFRQSRLQPEAKLAVAWDLTERLGLSVNLNAASLVDSGDRYSEIGTSVSLGIGLSDRIGSYAEFFTISPGLANGDTARYFNGGVTFLFNTNFQADVRYGIGIANGPGVDHFVGFGFARRFRW